MVLQLATLNWVCPMWDTLLSKRLSIVTISMPIVAHSQVQMVGSETQRIVYYIVFLRTVTQAWIHLLS